MAQSRSQCSRKTPPTHDRVIVIYNAGAGSSGAPERIYTKYSDTVGVGLEHPAQLVVLAEWQLARTQRRLPWLSINRGNVFGSEGDLDG
jgi:hypothetical protein